MEQNRRKYCKRFVKNAPIVIYIQRAFADSLYRYMPLYAAPMQDQTATKSRKT